MLIGIDIRNIGKKRTGDEVVFFNLVKNLAQIDKVNQYLLFTDITDITILRNMVVAPLGIENRNNFKIVSLKCLNKFVWNAWTLPRHLRKNPVDIYHTQYITPFFVSKKIKIVTTIHDISFNFYPQCVKWTDLFFLKILIPRSLKRADKIIAVSEFTKNEITKFYKINPDKIEIVKNSISDNFLKNSYAAEELAAVRKKYDLPDKFILYLGTMQPRKNLPQLIKAYYRVKDRLPGIKLVIAGKKGHNRDRKIDALTDGFLKEKEIIFTDYIDEQDKPILFKLSHVFVLPSLYEGFGIPVLEAMSQGTPVAASDIAGLREVGADAASYFDPLNLARMEEILYNICIDENLRNRLSISGLQRSTDFSWLKSAEKTLSSYKSLIN